MSAIEDNEKPSGQSVLSKLLREESPERLRLVVDDEPGRGTVLELTRDSLEALQRILELTEQGNEVEIIARDEELTTTEAADLLNVSRPHVVELMEAGKLPFHKVGSHRRISAGDVLDYKRAQKAESRDKMNALAEEDEKLNLEY